jgi:hypothetical protein
MTILFSGKQAALATDRGTDPAEHKRNRGAL